MSIDRNTRGMRVGRLLRLGVSGEGSSPAEVELGELEMELALLREENARLKVERHRPPDAGRVIERMRHLGGDESVEPVAANAIDDCRAMRDGLIVACQEVQLAMQGIRGRLGGLAVDLQDGVGVDLRDGVGEHTGSAERIGAVQVDVPEAESLDVELAEA